MAKIKVVIVEYLEEVVEGLSIFMQHDDTIQLMAAYRNAEAALLEIPLLSPDIVIMYINLPGMSGIECVRQLSRQKPDIQFMMFTVYENSRVTQSISPLRSHRTVRESLLSHRLPRLFRGLFLF